MSTATPSPGEPPAAPAPTPVDGPAGASAWVTIDLGAIRDNVAALARHASGSDVMAVVKADAYGHGLVPVAEAALAGGASWLAVAQLAEARALRAAGVQAPLLAWLFPPGADLAGALTEGIDLGLGATWSFAETVAAAHATGRTARVHLKIDTGLGRGGALDTGWDALVDAAARAAAEGSVEIVGVWSHFAWADAPAHPTVRAQQEVFEDAVAGLARRGIRPLRHLANSAATLTNPTAHYDLVRPGLAIYGLSPVPDLGHPEDFGLREAMGLHARLTSVKAARAGQGVSYGHDYTTARDTVLGLVPLGYSDGVPRSASGAGPVLLGAQRLPVAGRVCMDQFVLDLGPSYAGGPGDVVTVLGRHALGEPTAQDWALAAGTINYEIVTRMSTRLPRVFVGADSATGEG